VENGGLGGHGESVSWREEGLNIQYSMSNIQSPMEGRSEVRGPGGEVGGAKQENRGNNRNTGRGEGTEDGGRRARGDLPSPRLRRTRRGGFNIQYSMSNIQCPAHPSRILAALRLGVRQGLSSGLGRREDSGSWRPFRWGPQRGRSCTDGPRQGKKRSI